MADGSSEIKQRRISDVAFTLDSHLQVIEANRSFLRLFNTVDSNVNLGDYMSKTDRENFLHFLSTYHNGMENPYFIVEFKPREDHMNCIVQVVKE